MKTKPKAPPKKQKKPVDTVISLRISAELYQAISQEAEEENRTFGAMARILLHEGFIGYEHDGGKRSASELRGAIAQELWRFAHPKKYQEMIDKS
jgi:hypothetical protein